MDGSLRVAYREQFKIYSSLTQEEVEELYAREGIQDKPASEIIKDIEEEIRVLKSEREKSIKEIRVSAHEHLTIRYREITARIATIEEKRTELKRIQRELEELMPDIDSSNGLSSSITTIDKEIEKLKNEWNQLKDKERELDVKEDEIYREAKSKIDALEEKLSKIKADYASVFKQLYSSSRGIIRRKRKFPSTQLRNEIVLGHLELAKNLAAKYYILCDKKIEFDDLHQTAYEALMSAAHYYIPSPRAKFKTYATRCIENKLKRSIGEAKKKKRRRPTKPLEFIDEELRRIDYVLMLADACRKVRGKDGNKHFSNHFDLKPVGVQYNFKRSIRTYNSNLRKLGLTKEQLPAFKVKKSAAGFQKILDNALSYMKDSKMKVLLSPEDFEMASLVVSNGNHATDLREIYEFLYAVELYQSRLRDVRLLLEVEIELANEKDGIIPSNEELLDEINRRIAIENKGIYKARKSTTSTSLESLHNYDAVYCDLWGVNFLAQKWETDSRASEIKKLEEDFEYIQSDALAYYRSLIEDLSYSLEDKIYLYRHNEDYDECSSFLENWDEEPSEYIEKRAFTKEQIEKLIAELENFPKEQYVERVLQRRKRIALETLNQHNAKVIEKNRALESTIRQQQATSYVRYWTMEKVQDATAWINALYKSGLTIDNSNPKETKKPSQSVEDEAIGNIFMRDYIHAVNCLPPLTKDVLLLYYDESGTRSLSAIEIAKKLGITEKTVYREKDKALRLLRKNEVLKAYLE